MPPFSETIIGNLNARNILILTLGTLILGQIIAYGYGYITSGFATPTSYIKLGWALQYAFYLIGFYLLIRLGFATAGGGIAPHPYIALTVALLVLLIGIFLQPITAAAHVPLFSAIRVDFALQPFSVVGIP